ncbi:MAG: coproporphyrinogen dehydrogenase HemZ [Clostridiales Family XIII bacterium]|jgi:oxygen-independent coproporphyrinogen-3 oxidase|nr:coproporphyrinogen dehydrogenase HemZ [Clostridiales Family XIII bacterium]
MSGFVFVGVQENEYVELIKMFLRPSEFSTEPAAAEIAEAAEAGEAARRIELPAALTEAGDKNAVKRFLYDRLFALTGKRLPWGILTGVRPVKLFGELAAAADAARARRRFRGEYYVSGAKTDLTARIYALQRARTAPPEQGAVGIYIGIPFCPTRCRYCSFTSNQVPYARVGGYLAALRREMDFVAEGMARKDLYAESIYIGGGTPTALSETDFDELLGFVRRRFAGAGLREFTVEAGRPDTITAEKLRAMRRHGADRVSINPQSMNDATLLRIGRDHTAKDVRAAFRLARDCGALRVNADLIAGLPGEETADFRRSLSEVLDLAPANITIHALAVKRAARLKEEDAEYSYAHAETAAEMLEKAAEELEKAAYAPYYLYRQKQTAGNLENTGYARDGELCLYNVRIMEERQTVIALGAGASSKLFVPEENRLTRAFNVSDYEIYTQRLAEMLARKQRLLFE